jgi:hypothetical protein
MGDQRNSCANMDSYIRDSATDDSGPFPCPWIAGLVSFTGT